MYEFISGGYSKVDVDRVDLKKYSNLANIPWHYAKMEAGDCLYIPYKYIRLTDFQSRQFWRIFRWAHHVKSSPPRNLAINFWWERMVEFPNPKACLKQIEQKHDFEPYADNQKYNPKEKLRFVKFASKSYFFIFFYF